MKKNNNILKIIRYCPSCGKKQRVSDAGTILTSQVYKCKYYNHVWIEELKELLIVRNKKWDKEVK